MLHLKLAYVTAYVQYSIFQFYSHIFPSEARSVLVFGRDRMASMAISCVPSKRSFFPARVNEVPSPALGMSNMVSYLHEQSQ